MRPDMHKVVTERPRCGGRLGGYHSVRPRGTIEQLDLLPSKEGIRYPYGYDRKEFSDLISPLYRFLVSRVGRLWNEVYSEIRQRLNPKSTIQIHILSHIYQFVERNPSFDDAGIPQRSAYRRPVPAGYMYVHPQTGVLCRQPEKSYRTRRHKKADPNLHLFKDGREARKLKGIWYWMLFAEVDAPCIKPHLMSDGRIHLISTGGQAYDSTTGQWVSYPGRYRIDKKQMNSRELRKYNLQNNALP